MADSGKTLKHFVIVRFFSRQSINYPYSVVHPEFLLKHATLAKRTVIQSLENQTNKNFELIFVMHPRVFVGRRYNRIREILQAPMSFPIKLVKKGRSDSLVKAAYKNYDYVISTRIDLDDFVYKDAVADTQSKVNKCNKILSYGYCNGYMYFDENLYTYQYLSNGIGHHSVFQSLIVNSSFAKNLPFVGIYSLAHHKSKNDLKAFLEENNVAFSEDMFQQNVSTNAYIYYRHEQAKEISAKKRNMLDNLRRVNSMLVEDMTKEQLAEEFGFDYEVKSLK